MEKKYNSFCRILLNLRKLHYGSETEHALKQDLLDRSFDCEGDILTCEQLASEEPSLPPTMTEIPVIRTLELEEGPSSLEQV